MALFNRSEPPFTVDVPRRSADQPSWMRIGGIAIVGFVIGVAWPKLAGVRLGPNAPQEATATKAGAATTEGAAQPAANVAENPSAKGGPLPASMAAQNPGTGNAASPGTSAAGADVQIKNGVLISCKTEDGGSLKGRSCGSVNFDGIAQPRIKRLAQCPAARGVEGRLGITFNLDFRTNRATLAASKSTSLANADALVDCIKPAFESVSLSALGHDHPKYALLYNVTLGPSQPGRGGEAAGVSNGTGNPARKDAPPSDGAEPTAEIIYEVAIVRDKPRMGAIAGRLPRGTRVRIGAPQDGWYPIKYGSSFASEGYVYRAAIGR